MPRRAPGAQAGMSTRRQEAKNVLKKISALLVHNRADHLHRLTVALRRQSVSLTIASTCREAGREVARANPPHLVFTDACLPDGSWADVLALVAKAAAPVNVIVVAPQVDTKLYVEVIENGAFDFLVPPFENSDLAHILRCAIDNVLSRREVLARAELRNQLSLAPSSFRPRLQPAGRKAIG